ncbi:MAG: hypothetical protein ACRD6I_13655 [Candidatus Acidiferrales bacterium]
MRRKALSLGILAFALTAVAMGQGKVRVYVTDSKSWEVKGGVGVADGSGGGSVGGGARPQTAEIIKTFNERCPEVIVTMNREKADFVVLLEHEGGKTSSAATTKWWSSTKRATCSSPTPRAAWATR